MLKKILETKAKIKLETETNNKQQTTNWWCKYPQIPNAQTKDANWARHTCDSKLKMQSERETESVSNRARGRPSNRARPRPRGDGEWERERDWKGDWERVGEFVSEIEKVRESW